MRKILVLLLLLLTPFTAFAADDCLDVSRGIVHNVTQKYVFGGTDTLSTSLINIGDTVSINFPTAAAILNITSTDATDNSAGVGARTIRLSGLDSSGLEITETVTMNGFTGAVSVNSYLRLNLIEVLTTGTALDNAGTIYAFTGDETNGVPDDATTVYNMILPGNNISSRAVYSVPAKQTAYLTDISFGSAGTDETKFAVLTRNRGLTNSPYFPIEGVVLKGSELTKTYSYPLKINGGYDIIVYGQNLLDSDTAAHASFQLRLEK